MFFHFLEKSLTFRLTFLFIIIATLGAFSTASAQVDSVIGQLSVSNAESFAGGMSGNGRFVVFESRGDLATENPRNSDNNIEIFLFDYAQRRIFQITDTKSVVRDPALGTTFNNIRVEIVNTRPVISNDGRWIAFSSNATIAYPGDGLTHPPVISSTNPGSFDGNAFTSPTPTPSPSPSPSATPGDNPLTIDGNLEMWLYQIPTVAPVADLSLGDEIPLTNLAGGTFIRVTNTLPSQYPRAGTATSGAFIADDNHDASISDDGSSIAFVSTRDLVPCVGNSLTLNVDNDEIFTFRRDGTVPCTGAITGEIGVRQVTNTPRGQISNPIYNKYPTISGNGSRVAFASTGDGPIDGMVPGGNPLASRNEEIFYADLVNGGPTSTSAKVQVTTTTPTHLGDPVNILSIGRRMSRNGRYIAFDSYADLGTTPAGPNRTSFALYVYDTQPPTPIPANYSPFSQVGLRSDADAGAAGGDVIHYPGFTDTDASGSPSTLVLETRMNIKPDGTIPTVPEDGLNNSPQRQAQIYSYPINVPVTVPPTPAIFTRLTRLPVPTSFIASTQVLASNSIKRVAFNLALSELGLGNPDRQSEVYYMITPTAPNKAVLNANFATGASGLPVSQTAIPSPSPTPTPTATPTPSPTPTPTPSPTPTPTGSPTPTPTPTPVPTPTPLTPDAVFGLSPGMRAILNYPDGFEVTPRTGVGSLKRSFTLPIELSGISVTINGAACGLKSVSRNRIEFVLPPELIAAVAGTAYPLVVINNGSAFTTSVTLVPTRPDIFNVEGIAGPGGRTKVFNVTNRVFTTEPFTVTTRRIRPFGRVPSRLRVYVTGVQNVVISNNPTIRIGSFTNVLVPIVSDAVLVEPGVYTIDFTLPPEANGGGDQPIILTIMIGGVTFSSRLDDTATRFRIL